MHKDECDFTNTFRALSSIPTSPQKESSGSALPQELLTVLGEGISQDRKLAWIEWMIDYQIILQKEGMDQGERISMQNSSNPKYIPRQHLLQLSIEEAERGDFGELNRLMKVVSNPFEDLPGMDKYCQPPPKQMIKPGVTILSCSS